MLDKTLTIAALAIATLCLTAAPAAAHDDHSHDVYEDIPPPPPPLPPATVDANADIGHHLEYDLDYDPTLQLVAASAGSVVGAIGGAAVGGIAMSAGCSNGFSCRLAGGFGLIMGGVIGTTTGALAGLTLAGPEYMTPQGTNYASIGLAAGAGVGLLGFLTSMKLAEDHPQHGWLPMTGAVLGTASVGLGAAIGYQIGHNEFVENLSLTPVHTGNHTGFTLSGSF